MTAKTDKTCVTLNGITGSRGFCVAPVYVFRKRIEVKRYKIEKTDIEKELQRLEMAVEMTRKDIEESMSRAKDSHGEKYAAIFDSHLLMLDDSQFLPKIIDKIKNEQLNVESVVRERVDEIQGMFSQIEDPYLRERALDIKDVGGRILRHLLGLEGPAREIGDEPYILVAQEVTPSEMLDFAKGKLQGICLDSGGATSHVAILASALGIPSVFGLSTLSRGIRTGDTILIDTRDECKVILHPEQDAIKALKESDKDEYADYIQSDTTQDGKKITLSVNIAHNKELESLKKLNIDRIGLFRSEFTFMSCSDLPSEDFQYEAYKQVVQAAKSMTVLRTLDVGSDKPLKYLPMAPEENPAMGFRSVRLTLARPDILRPQLRAMLKASAYGNCTIIFPMVSTPQELQIIDKIYKEAIEDVKPEHVPEWGIMLEVPSAIYMMEEIGKYTKYISLGTNDLLQFFYALDRTNNKLANLATHHEVAFLKLIKHCVDEAKKFNIKIAVCGEMASDIFGFTTLIGLGITELSVRPNAVKKIKSTIPIISADKARNLILGILESDVNSDIKAQIVNEFPQLAELV